MSALDFSPLFRSTVGFDRLARLAEAAQRMDQGASYPPYNIEKVSEDAYRIELAVAGFSEDELSLESKGGELTVVGKKETREDEVNYLHRGIATRDFFRKFQLADHVKVVGANLDNGMLSIELVREVPEEMKPRSIEIKRGITGKALPKSKAA